MSAGDFQFVTLSHPGDVKSKQQQSLIRGHAIRNSAKKIRNEAEKCQENFVIVEMNLENPRPKKRTRKPKTKVARSPSARLLDPFRTLPGSPERLAMLMRHKAAKQAGEPIFCITDAGKMLFQGMEAVFKGALSDPALFHALSMVLSLAANKGVPNVECLTHRGELLGNLRTAMWNPLKLSHVSTLTAMLLLIGIEYRIDGTKAGKSISMHISAVAEIIKVTNTANILFSDAIRRALFWQDLHSCLLVGTSRLMSHTEFAEFGWKRDTERASYYVVPSGFLDMIDAFPSSFAAILEDLHALCTLYDAQCPQEWPAIYELRIDDRQAWLESRIVDLIHTQRQSEVEDPIYMACLMATYLCTYKLSTVIWEGCFLPEWTAAEILSILSRTVHDPRWELWPEMLVWLLCVGGALADRSVTRQYAKILILDVYRDQIEGFHRDWDVIKNVLKMFVWNEQVLEPKLQLFWEEVHPDLRYHPLEWT